MSNLSVIARYDGHRYRSADGSFQVINLALKEVLKLSGEESKLRAGDNVVAVGSLPDMTLTGVDLHVSGLWQEHSKYGWRLNMRSVRIEDPVDTKGILEYLGSGLIKGIGPVIAKRIVKRFGANAFKVLDDMPEAILEIKGIGNITAQKIAGSWKAQRAEAKLLQMVCSIGLSVAYARRVFRKFGHQAVDMITANPYVLTEVEGIGFLKADRIALDMGLDPKNPTRFNAALIYSLKMASYGEGHCFLTKPELIKNMTDILKNGISDIKSLLESVKALIENEVQKVSAVLFDNGRYTLFGQRVTYCNERFYLPEIYRAERYVSESLHMMKARVKNSSIQVDWTAASLQSSKLTTMQKEAVVSALQYGASMITGGPGTGKTTSVKELVGLMEDNKLTYCLCAPTGKAAKRMSESTGREAKTIHRLLEFNPQTRAFNRDENNPLTENYVIVDEASMIDILLMESLLRGMSRKTSLILIGDCDQLPSVGPGNLVRDIKAQKLLPVNELTEIHRQAEESFIIRTAHAINRGIFLMPAGASGIDVEFIEEEDPIRIKEAIVRMILSQETGFTIPEIQVLSPMKKGPIGVDELNEALSLSLQEVKKKSAERKGLKCVGESGLIKFTLLDRVIQMKNNYNTMRFNGDIGHVWGIDNENNTLSIKFADGGTVFYDEDDIDQLKLAYALTVHKSQGSEFPCVIMPIHTAHYIMLFRNLFYTAVTRAVKKLILVGSKKAASLAAKVDKPIKRNTHLSA